MNIGMNTELLISYTIVLVNEMRVFILLFTIFCFVDICYLYFYILSIKTCKLPFHF